MPIWIIGMFLMSFLLNLIFVGKKNKYGSFITKMLLVPLLIVLYLVRESAPSSIVLLALSACFLGDLFMEFSGKGPFFQAGLFSFLAGHIFYSAYFLLNASSTVVPWWLYLILLVYAAFGISFCFKLAIGEKKKSAAIAVYCTVILAMSFLALLRAVNGSALHLWLAFAGSLLFVSSDSVLAYHRFKAKIRYSGVWVMATYGMAQLLIVFGL